MDEFHQNVKSSIQEIKQNQQELQDELKIADQKGVVLATAIKENVTAVKEATDKN